MDRQRIRRKETQLFFQAIGPMLVSHHRDRQRVAGAGGMDERQGAGRARQVIPALTRAGPGLGRGQWTRLGGGNDRVLGRGIGHSARIMARQAPCESGSGF